MLACRYVVANACAVLLLVSHHVLAGILSINVLIMFYGADKHQRNVYRHVFIVLAAISTQLGSLVTWVLLISAIGQTM